MWGFARLLCQEIWRVLAPADSLAEGLELEEIWAV